MPKKEGRIKIECDLLDIWDGKGKDITLYDNNILAAPEHFALICKQAKERKLKLDFNQGLDHRLITNEIAKELADISHKEYHFAFDNPAFYKSVSKALDALTNVGIKRSNWYVLVGFNTSPKEDLDRLNFLRDRGQRVYVQRYRTHFFEPFYVALSRWGNQPNLFATMTWQQFLDYPRKDHARLKKSIGNILSKPFTKALREGENNFSGKEV